MSTSSSINIPQLIAVLLIAGVAIRYFFFSRAPASANTSSFPGSASQSQSRRGRGADPRHVEQIAQMFPQVGRREIMWDLQRNGGSVAATSERILNGGGLDMPPPSFQPPSLASSSPNALGASGSSSSFAAAPQDLITRYNLSSKLSQPHEASAATGGKKKAGWAANKNDRQALLHKRREEMILNARRKLEEKDKKVS